MKIALMFCIMAAMSIVSCRDSPQQYLQHKKQFLHSKNDDLNNIVKTFNASSLRKVTWSKTKFITVVDQNDNSWSGRFGEQVMSSAGAPIPDALWAHVVLLYDQSRKLNICQIESSIGLYLTFEDRSCLLIDYVNRNLDIGSLTRNQPYVQVSAGWYLFYDRY
jgi:hypothetical protein